MRSIPEQVDARPLGTGDLIVGRHTLQQEGPDAVFYMKFKLGMD